MRDYDKEIEDNSDRKYNYNFDIICRRFFLKRIDRYLNKDINAKSLEIGSFDGSMTDLILEKLGFVHVLEPSKKMVDLLSQKFEGKVNVHEGIIEKFESKIKFDNLFLVHTLEHVDNPVLVLDKIYDLMSPEGLVFIAVPNGNAISRQIAVKMRLIEHNTAVTSGERAQGHLRTYTLDTLLSDVTKSKLKIVDYGGIIFKALANFQFDKALDIGIISEEYLNAADQLAIEHPNFGASIYVICKK
jgi:2-polyprenyl-3-methyl-5-hydroxy-6-metoxy-1,4-benzoquinol methylase